jgi:hypothetical protein
MESMMITKSDEKKIYAARKKIAETTIVEIRAAAALKKAKADTADATDSLMKLLDEIEKGTPLFPDDPGDDDDVAPPEDPTPTDPTPAPPPEDDPPGAESDGIVSVSVTVFEPAPEEPQKALPGPKKRGRKKASDDDAPPVIIDLDPIVPEPPDYEHEHLGN